MIPKVPDPGGSSPPQTVQDILFEIAKRDFLLQEIEIWKAKQILSLDLAATLAAPYLRQRSILQARLAAEEKAAAGIEEALKADAQEGSSPETPALTPANPETPAPSDAVSKADPRPVAAAASEVVLPAEPSVLPAQTTSAPAQASSAQATPAQTTSASAQAAPAQTTSVFFTPRPAEEAPIRIGFVKKPKTPAAPKAVTLDPPKASAKPGRKVRDTEAEAPDELGGEDEGGDLSELPMLEERKKRSKDDEDIWKRSTWMTVLRPFLMQNWLYFVGTFLVLASGFYLLSLVWEGMSALAKGAVVWGGLMGGATAFTGVGAWLLRRYALETAGRTFWLVGSGLTGIASVAVGSLALDGQIAGGALILGSLGLMGWNDRVLRRLNEKAAKQTTLATGALALVIGLLPWLMALQRWSGLILLYLGAFGLFVILQRLPWLLQGPPRRVLEAEGAGDAALVSGGQGATAPLVGGQGGQAPQEGTGNFYDRLLFGGPVVGIYALLVGFGGWLLWKDLGGAAIPWFGGLVGLWGVLLITGVEPKAWKVLREQMRGRETGEEEALSGWLLGGLLLGLAGVGLARGTAFPLWLASLVLLLGGLLLTGLFRSATLALVTAGAWVFLNLSFLATLFPTIVGGAGWYGLLEDRYSVMLGLAFLPCIGGLWLLSERWGGQKARETWGVVVFGLWLGLSIAVVVAGQREPGGLALLLPLYLAGYAWLSESHRSAWIGYLGISLFLISAVWPLRGWLGGSWLALSAMLGGVAVGWFLARGLEKRSKLPTIRGVLDGGLFLSLPAIFYVILSEPTTQAILDFRSWKPSTDSVLALSVLAIFGILHLWAAGATRSPKLPYLGLLLTGVFGIVLSMSIPRWLGLPTRPWSGALVSGLAAFALYEISRRGWGWQRSVARALSIPIFVPRILPQADPRVSDVAQATPQASERGGAAERGGRGGYPTAVDEREAAKDLWEGPLYHASVLAMAASLGLAFWHPRLVTFYGFQTGISALCLLYLLRLGLERKEARFGLALFGVWFLMLGAFEKAAGWFLRLPGEAAGYGFDATTLQIFGIVKASLLLAILALVYVFLPSVSPEALEEGTGESANHGAEGESSEGRRGALRPSEEKERGRALAVGGGSLEGWKAVFGPSLQMLPWVGFFGFFWHWEIFFRWDNQDQRWLAFALLLGVFFTLLGWMLRGGIFVLTAQVAWLTGIVTWCAGRSSWLGLRYLGVVGGLAVLYGIGALGRWGDKDKVAPKMGGWFASSVSLPCETADELWGKMHRGFALSLGLLAAFFGSVLWADIFASNAIYLPGVVLPRGVWAGLALGVLAGLYLGQGFFVSRQSFAAKRWVFLQGSVLLGVALAAWAGILAVADGLGPGIFLLNRTWLRWSVEMAMLLAGFAALLQGIIGLFLWRYPLLAAAMRWSRITGRSMKSYPQVAAMQEKNVITLFPDQVLVALRLVFMALCLGSSGLIFGGASITTGVAEWQVMATLVLPGFLALFLLPSRFALLWLVALATAIGISQRLPLWIGGVGIVAGLAVFFGRWFSLWREGIPRFVGWSRFGQAALSFALLLLFLPLAWAASTTGKVFPFWGFACVGVALGLTLWQEICRAQGGGSVSLYEWRQAAYGTISQGKRPTPPETGFLWRIWWEQGREAVEVITYVAMGSALYALWRQGLDVRWLVAFAVIPALWDVFHQPRKTTMFLVSVGGTVSLAAFVRSLGWLDGGAWSWGWPVAGAAAIWLGLWCVIAGAEHLADRQVGRLYAAAGPGFDARKALWEARQGLASFLQTSVRHLLIVLFVGLSWIWLWSLWKAVGLSDQAFIEGLPGWWIVGLFGLFVTAFVLSKGRIVGMQGVAFAALLWPFSLAPWLQTSVGWTLSASLLWGSGSLLAALLLWIDRQISMRREVWNRWQMEFYSRSAEEEVEIAPRWKTINEEGKETFDQARFQEESSYLRGVPYGWLENFTDRGALALYAFVAGILSFGSAWLVGWLPLAEAVETSWLASGFLLLLAYLLLLGAAFDKPLWSHLVALCGLWVSYGLLLRGLGKPLFGGLYLSVLGGLALVWVILLRGGVFLIERGGLSSWWGGRRLKSLAAEIEQEIGRLIPSLGESVVEENARRMERSLREAMGLFSVFALVSYPLDALWQGGQFSTIHHVTYLAGLPTLSLLWLRIAVKKQTEIFAWFGVFCFFGLYAYLRKILGLGGQGWDAWLLLVVGFVMLGFRVIWSRIGGEILERVIRRASLLLPLLAVASHLLEGSLFQSQTPQVFLMAGIFYLTTAFQIRQRWLFVPSFFFFNLAILGFLRSKQVEQNLWYVLPLSVSAMFLTSIFGDKLQRGHRQAIRILAGLPIYLSGIYQVFLFSQIKDVLLLAGLSIAGILFGIAFQIRSYLYLGTSFLILNVGLNLFRIGLQDRVIGMIFLFLTGILLLGFAVFFNLKRDQILERIKTMNARMASWDG